jgi:disulfide bond formation protein DsbB
VIHQKLFKNLTTKHVHVLLILVSMASLAFAYIAEYGFQVLPCDFCLYERGVYMAVFAVGILSLKMKALKGHRGLFLQLFVLSAGIALTFYHVGMEQHWWAGPASCSGAGQAASFEEFRAQLMKTVRPRCDQINWTIFGISATAWNLMLQGFLAFLTSLGLYLPKNRD